MSNASKRGAERQAILAELRAKQKAKQRQWNILVYSSFGLVLAAIITAVAVVVTGAVQEKYAATEAAKKPMRESRPSRTCPATTSRTLSPTRRNPGSAETTRASGRTAGSIPSRE